MTPTFKLLLRGLCFGLALTLAAASLLSAAEGRTLNILFLAVDDLRPQLGCYGVTDIRTPNIDRLAREGLLFNRAYCQQAVCSPSRTSLLTGRRPDTTKVYDLVKHFRDVLPDVITLPQHFKNNGYFCQSFGKIYHGGLDDPRSWSAPSVGAGVVAVFPQPDGSIALTTVDEDYFQEGGAVQLVDTLRPPLFRTVADTGNGKGKNKAAARKARAGKPPWSAPDVADNELGDGKMADAAIEVMRANKDKPFFLAVGFRKPHLSFDAPKRYYDWYEADRMRLAKNPYPPRDVFPPALSAWGELRTYAGMPQEGPVPDEDAKKLIRGYYSATSYTDAQLGRVIAELERLGLRDKTIIILWGDHGWQLGEHGMWCKHTCYETSTRSMLMISTPEQKTRGQKTEALVEFVDIYPTLCELAALPLTPGLEGTSFAPLVADPGRPWKKAAFSQYPRGDLMGYAMRTDRYRYVEWVKQGTAQVEGRELYDHRDDPDENENVAARAENRDLIVKLSAQLKAGWKAAMPQ
jgi:iduronate 2-sulfatase